MNDSAAKVCSALNVLIWKTPFAPTMTLNEQAESWLAELRDKPDTAPFACLIRWDAAQGRFETAPAG